MAKKSYNLTVGNVRCYYNVYIADRKSTKFLNTCCYEKLAKLAAKIPNPGLNGGAVVQGDRIYMYLTMRVKYMR